ncbi:MAG: hypothetical protein ACTS4Z_01850 [Candidatus Hodgkinia cicadicola]
MRLRFKCFGKQLGAQGILYIDRERERGLFFRLNGLSHWFGETFSWLGPDGSCVRAYGNNRTQRWELRSAVSLDF